MMSRPATNGAPKTKKGVNKRKLMNSMVNIPSTNPDPYYRYKMPALEIRINPARVRTNNPQKETVEIPASTQIQNLIAVARALNRPLEYLSKFFELELEMQGVMDDRQRWFKLLGGEIKEQELMLTLDKFIRRFVLCYVCNNPETALTIFNTHIMKECGACGQSTRVDRFSKLTRFILRGNRNFAMGFAPVVVDATKCRFLKEGATVPQSKGTVMNNAGGFKNGVKIATAAEMAGEDSEEEEDDDDDQDWKLDTSDAAVAERRLKELDLITRVEKIMNAGLGDKAKDPYKVFEEFVLTRKDSDSALPDKEEVLGRFYTLDLEKEGAIFVLEKLQKRQETEPEMGSIDHDTTVSARSDYAEIIHVLRDSLEREVVVESLLESSDSDLDSSDDSNSDSDSDLEK
ncbi:translation initiation factor 5 [Entomortierella parvispora]|uniref:Translation initiation factor 5 n=1 Tax=Entomortierella parvispora TaxID=205924 RepID=A0A9P3HE49_9FUNG|nr:translation initiation factor 5 [Entomortierella parvispora]